MDFSSLWIAFIRCKNIWVTDLSGHETQLTLSEAEGISNGRVEYVVQEEFKRFQGYWWQPGTLGDLKCILYISVDENPVGLVRIGQQGQKSIRYPRVGEPNAHNTIRIVYFNVVFLS